MTNKLTKTEHCIYSRTTVKQELDRNLVIYGSTKSDYPTVTLVGNILPSGITLTLSARGLVEITMHELTKDDLNCLIEGIQKTINELD